MPVRHLTTILASVSHPRTLSHIDRTVSSSPSQSLCALFCAVLSCVLPAGPSDHGPDSSQHQHASISTKFHDPGRADGLHGDRSCLPYLPYFYGRPSGWWCGEDTHMHTHISSDMDDVLMARKEDIGQMWWSEEEEMKCDWKLVSTFWVMFFFFFLKFD